MSLSESTVVDQATRTAARVVGGNAVVVVIDENKLHTLNEVGTRVWEFSCRRSLREIAETVAEEYEVAAEVALSDVLLFAESLVSQGMLDIVREP